MRGWAGVAALALAGSVGGCAADRTGIQPVRLAHNGSSAKATGSGCPARANDRSCLALADLNGDGSPELLIYAADASRCGSGGCDLVVLTQRKADWSIVAATTVTRLPIHRLTTRTNGWSDLGVTVGGGGVAPGVARMRFDGRRYPDNPTLQPLAAPEELGEVLLAESEPD